MNPREKRLAIAAAVLLVLALVTKVVYPRTVKSLFDVQDRIEELDTELADRLEERDRVDDALLQYKQYLARTGGTDPQKVRNRLQKHLEQLARDADLPEPNTKITPGSPSRDKKTGLHTVPMGVDVQGSLETVVGFVKRCYELPYLAKFRGLTFDPVVSKGRTGGSRGSKSATGEVKVNAMLEVLVLPNDPIAREHLDLESLEQPTEVVKHSGESYALIWERNPFSEYVKPVAKRQEREPEKEPEQKPEPKPQEQPDRGDRDANYKRVAMALRYGVDELMVVNTRSKTQEYVTTGEQIDGGELIYVHLSGGIVRKESGDYFYEVGALFSEAVPVAIADDFPGIQAISKCLRDVPLRGASASLAGKEAARPGKDAPRAAKAGKTASKKGRAASSTVRKPRRPPPRRGRTVKPTAPKRTGSKIKRSGSSVKPRGRKSGSPSGKRPGTRPGRSPRRSGDDEKEANESAAQNTE